MSQKIRSVGSLTYERCLAKLGRKDTVSIGPNTWIRKLSYSECAVLFHRTFIIRFYADGAVILDSGDYRTVTTKDRMDLSGFQVSQRKFVWYVNGREFYDGINVGVPHTEKEAIQQAAERGDHVAIAMLHDMKQESHQSA